MRRVREASLDAYAHQDVPFEKLVDELAPERSLATTPLFQAVFVLQNAPHERPALGELALEPLAAGTDTAKFDLTLALEETDGRLSGVLNYASDLFDPTTLMRLVGQLERLLDAAVAAPNAPAAEIPLASHAERQQALVEWNERRQTFPRRGLAELFGIQVERRPEAVALVDDDAHWSLAALDREASGVAWALARRGVGPEARVALWAPRSAETVIAILGIVKAGGAYLPLDRDYPAERLRFMIEDSRAAVLLGDAGDLGWLGGSPGVEVLPPAALRAEERHDLAAGYAVPVDPHNLAYVIYTSGSTGRPKGVMVEQASVARLVLGVDYVLLGPDEVVLQAASISFDASTFELWGALLHGAKLVVAPAGVPSLAGLGSLLERERVSVTLLTAGLFHALIDQEGDRLATVDQVLAGGEALSVPHVRQLLARGRGAVINGYGPTEATTFGATRRFTAARELASSVQIGRPLDENGAFVVTADGGAAGIGVPGELCLGGAGLARGYLDRPALTAERFVPDAWSGERGARLYRTGDRARFLANGEIEFLGRIDFQVKLRGFRIELGEIEAALLALPGVAEAAVLLRDDLPGGRALAAYVVARDEGLLSTEALRAALRERLPDHMVPAWLTLLDALPLTTAGKVDRRALARLEGPRREGAAAAPPRTPVEALIAAAYAELLGVAAGREDSFFDLGGHSLLATQLVSRLREAFAVELPVRAVFEAPTVADLAAFVERERRGGAAQHPAPALVRIERRGPAPLSFAQERLWFLDQLEPGSTTYNVPAAVLLSGVLDVAALAEAFSAVVARHESLRTTFATDSGRPVQVISPPSPFLLPVVDLGALASAEQERELRRLAERHAGKPFDLAHGPLLRAVLARLDTAARASTGCCSPCTTSSRTAGPWACWCARSPCSTRPASRESPRPCRRSRCSTPTSPRGSAAGLAVRCWKPSWPTGGGSWPEPRPCSSCPQTGRGRQCGASAGQASPWASLPS